MHSATVHHDKVPQGGARKKAQARAAYAGGMAHHEPRPAVRAVLLQAAIRVRYLLESWFFLKPLLASRLSGSPSFLRPKGIPEVNWFVLFSVRILWLLGGVFRVFPRLELFFFRIGVITLLGRYQAFLMEHIAGVMENSDVDWEKAKNIPIPEYDWEKGSPEEFYQTFVRRPHPVILRNFIKGSEIMDYTFDNLVEKFGDTPVVLTGQKSGCIGKLKEVQDPDNYVQNSESLFNRHPELWKLLQTEKLEDYIKKKASYAQFFLGRKGTGAPLHFAAVWNFFYMVDGVKKWYFIDPTDFYVAYPRQISGGMSGNFFGPYPDEFKEDKFVAQKYCPYYLAELQPGDVLLNPAYWGHGIRNITDKSVGIATRWSVDALVGRNFRYIEEDYDINRFASFNFFLGLLSWPIMHMLLKEVSPQHDEHTTHREIGLSSIGGVMNQVFSGKHADGRKMEPF